MDIHMYADFIDRLDKAWNATVSYDEVCNRRRQIREELEKAIEDEVTSLMNTTSAEDLKKRFLRNFGCINFKGNDFYYELTLARAYHARLCNDPAHKDEHKHFSYEPYRCYHVTGCSCGFQEECDSGD